MRYLTVEEVSQINADLTGADLLRDAGLLASAVGRPSQTVFGEDAYPDLYTKIAALFESLACNHAFVDGNKRTAVVAAIHMLNQLDVHKLAEFFRRGSVPLDYGDEAEPTGTDEAD